MCGIVGYIGERNASSILLEGLRRLEYRGYDSAGVAVLDGADVNVRRAVGKLSALEGLLQEKPLHGTLGLGHTRWATHGRPTEVNAHPHTCCRRRIVVVHNGIIENYLELKTRLEQEGHHFLSETDTEAFAHLIEESHRGDLLTAVQEALKQVRGSYALGVFCADDRERVVVARKDSPLVLGIGEREMFLASDIPPLLPYTRRVLFLNDGEVAELTPQQIRVFDLEGRPVTRDAQTVPWDATLAQKDGFAHYMLKEIHEQRRTIRDTCRSRMAPDRNRVRLEEAIPDAAVRSVKRVCLIGCGTSYHAALVARTWFEEIVGIPCTVEIASEYRYRRQQKEPGTLAVAITQSGETADTLASLRDCKRDGLLTLAVCNVIGSTITRDAAHTLYTRCGPEIGVASTKAFTGQLTALFLLALHLAQNRAAISEASLSSLLEALAQLPSLVPAVLAQTDAIADMARHIAQAPQMLYLGRHLNYPIALEGALKMKEISYLHAEGYPGGEMKHGPIALIDDQTPVIGVVTQSAVREKMLSNLEEVKARGGRLIVLATAGDEQAARKADFWIPIPAVHEYLAPLLTVIPLQLLAYHVAVQRGCDVDQPRNLAKSVTVE